MIKNILFTKEEVLKLKNSEDEGLKALIEEIMNRAKDTLTFDLATVPGATNIDAIQHLGFGYFYTGDEAYVNKVIEIMKYKIDNELWISNEYDPDKYNGYDIRTALETGDRCAHMSHAFMLFGEAIPEDEIQTMATAVYEKGIKPILEDWVWPNHRIHALDTMGHNFWVTITSCCALACLNLKDYIPEGEKCLNDAIFAIKSWFEYPGNILNAKPQNNDNGSYWESPGYWDYSIREYLGFADAYKRATGKAPFDDTDLLNGFIKFNLHLSYLSDKQDYRGAFGDAGNDYVGGMLDLARYGMATPELRWYLKTRKNDGYNKIKKALLWSEIYDKPAELPKELSACYNKTGYAFFRDSFEENKTALMIKCGDTWNHAHADCGHFILFRNGRPEIYDSMTMSYSDPSYIGYYVESEAHNVLLFNGKGQDMRDNYKNHAHIPGRLLNYIDDNGFRYVVADGTGPMSRYFRKHHRHFLWLDGFILVYDDVECYDDGEVNFLLHAKVENCFRMLTPHYIKMCDGYKDRSKEPNDKYTSYNTRTDEEAHAKFIGVMVLDESIVPVIENLTDAYKITCGKTKVYINRRSDGKIMHRNCINTMDGIISDAVMVIDDGEKYGVVNGSIIRKDGKSYLETLARVTGWADTFK